MLRKRRASVLMKQKACTRAGKIIALVPNKHALSETDENSDSEHEIYGHSGSPASCSTSPAPSLDSSLERLNILDSPTFQLSNIFSPEHAYNSDSTKCSLETPSCTSRYVPESPEINNVETVPLTPIFDAVCLTPSREPNYEDIPSLSALPSVSSVVFESPAVPSTSNKRKTRSSKQLKQPAKKKRVTKFTLQYKWRKAVYKHAATIETNDHENIADLPEPTALSYFHLFFSHDIYEDIVTETNMYSVQRTGKSIQLTVNELKDFIATHVIMGIVRMSSYRDYWNTAIRYNLVADVMPLNRFEKIRRFIHFADNTEENSDRYFKVRPVAEKIRKNCLAQENEKMFSIDEMMIAYKGRKAGKRKQYMKDKPNKWGFKTYVRAGVSGLIYDFTFYGGEDTFRYHTFTDDETSLGFGAHIVIALCKSIKKKPATIFCDNFVSSPELFVILRENYGIFGLGTIRNNRLRGGEKVLPDEKKMKKKPKGSYAQAVCDKNRLIIVRWNDNKPVTLISSYVGVEPVQKIKRYCEEAKQKVEVDCPKIVAEYNKHMGGVDLADMLIALYKTPMKSRRWYLTIFAQLIDICVNNAWLLHRKNCGKGKALKWFRHEVFEGLIKAGRFQQLRTREVTKIVNPSKPRPSETVKYDNVGHFPSTKDEGRCRFCNKKTTVFCIKCDMRLCFVIRQK